MYYITSCWLSWLQGQVTRAQEAEEMLHMQKDVSVMKRKVAELEKENQKLQQVL